MSMPPRLRCFPRALEQRAVASLLFASFGLFSRANVTIIVTLLVCALSVSGAVFLVLEMDRPFSGMVKISSAPLRGVLAQLDR